MHHLFLHKGFGSLDIKQKNSEAGIPHFFAGNTKSMMLCAHALQRSHFEPGGPVTSRYVACTCRYASKRPFRVHWLASMSMRHSWRHCTPLDVQSAPLCRERPLGRSVARSTMEPSSMMTSEVLLPRRSTPRLVTFYTSNFLSVCEGRKASPVMRRRTNRVTKICCVHATL